MRTDLVNEVGRLVDEYVAEYVTDGDRIITKRDGNYAIRRAPLRGYLQGKGVPTRDIFPALQESCAARVSKVKFSRVDYPVDAYVIPGPISRLEAYFARNPDFGGWGAVVRMVEGGGASRNGFDPDDDFPEWEEARDAIGSDGLETWAFAKALCAVRDLSDSATIFRGIYNMLREIQAEGDDANAVMTFINYSTKSPK